MYALRRPTFSPSPATDAGQVRTQLQALGADVLGDGLTARTSQLHDDVPVTGRRAQRRRAYLRGLAQEKPTSTARRLLNLPSSSGLRLVCFWLAVFSVLR